MPYQENEEEEAPASVLHMSPKHCLLSFEVLVRSTPEIPGKNLLQAKFYIN